MKSIAEYLNSSEGTGPAIGKRFELYGLYIGQFKGVLPSGTGLLFDRGQGEVMEVPVQRKNLPGLEINGKEIGPILNPVLSDIKEV
ncbi:TPA: hypothetical protein U0V61_005086 [Escherichia coli]|nr:hypothetical protein [Escherichia coli]MED8844556.1 hypothetical protein [Escherichia coli]MED9368264.1 hypothetical protein [Escherichia coli]MED9701663.1 hypothetical protein [Escherichia coli]HAY0223944.1 hypothetical protein [Escherichia coli]